MMILVYLLKKRNEIKCLELFQIINEMGNYSDNHWFLNLDRLALNKIYKRISRYLGI